MASSARFIKAPAFKPCTYPAKPILKVSEKDFWIPSFVLIEKRSFSNAFLTRSATIQATDGSVSGKTTKNSSPPYRKGRSDLRTTSRSTLPRQESTLSPYVWPYKSLTCLKSSSSIIITVKGFLTRCERLTSSSRMVDRYWRL